MPTATTWAMKDPRLSIEERYVSKDDYLQKIRRAADVLIRDGELAL